jgi:hypothetical protein
MLKSVQVIFLSSVSLGKIFQIFGKLFQFENCLHSLVCFSAKLESSVTCARGLYRVILTTRQWDYAGSGKNKNDSGLFDKLK